MKYLSIQYLLSTYRAYAHLSYSNSIFTFLYLLYLTDLSCGWRLRLSIRRPIIQQQHHVIGLTDMPSPPVPPYWCDSNLQLPLVNPFFHTRNQFFYFLFILSSSRPHMHLINWRQSTLFSFHFHLFPELSPSSSFNLFTSKATLDNEAIRSIGTNRMNLILVPERNAITPHCDENIA